LNKATKAEGQGDRKKTPLRHCARLSDGVAEIAPTVVATITFDNCPHY